MSTAEGGAGGPSLTADVADDHGIDEGCASDMSHTSGMKSVCRNSRFHNFCAVLRVNFLSETIQLCQFI